MKKSRIVPALSFGSRFRSNPLHAEFPAQSPDTDQSTAEQHERHTAVGNLCKQALHNVRVVSVRGKPGEIADIVGKTSPRSCERSEIGVVIGNRTRAVAGAWGYAVDFGPDSELETNLCIISASSVGESMRQPSYVHGVVNCCQRSIARVTRYATVSGISKATRDHAVISHDSVRVVCGNTDRIRDVHTVDPGERDSVQTRRTDRPATHIIRTTPEITPRNDYPPIVVTTKIQIVRKCHARSKNNGHRHGH